MFRALICGVLLTAVFSYENEGRIRMIWDDMDTDPFDGIVELSEVMSFFGAMANVNGEVLFFNFDYEWGTSYDDNLTVTRYIFDRFDPTNVTSTDVLTLNDQADVYALIDTTDSDSLGNIDFFWEFHPFFDNLYNDLNGISYNAQKNLLG